MKELLVEFASLSWDLIVSLFKVMAESAIGQQIAKLFRSVIQAVVNGYELGLEDAI